MAVKQCTQTRPEFTNFSSLPAGMDFIDLAEYNERLVAALMETDNDMERLSLYKKMAASLEQLATTYEEPVPDERLPQLTASNITAFHPVTFIAEPERVTQYCQALTRLLIHNQIDAEARLTLNDLLFDLVNYQVDDLKAPRYMETWNGLVQVR